ncbi:MAG: uroporphyrinogen synthase/methyltransferase [Nitrospirae bacterium]|nr:uroporphyrinogen synthase/methyltransferase [Nitrospirota bacterium]
MKGKVYLVGAGPGDIGLLTIKGLKCLRKADVVIYDFHLNAQVLNYINHNAEFIYAGKRGGHHTLTQDEINTILVRKAKEGRTVCRLKGGDPFIFGRGGEEAEALSKERIEFEVVPGISSSVAAPAYAGIPLTHRLYSSSFAVIPGYEDATKKESTIDWSKLSTGVGTLVFLMAVKNVDLIAQKLIENGRPPDTPVAVIRWGTRPDQKTIVGTLESIAELVKEKHIKPPAVMIVGEVVKLRETLKWYEKKQLFGYRILVTREHMEGFERLEELGAEIIEFPTIEIVPPGSYEEIDSSIKKITSYDWVVFTSRNGVKYFFRRFFEKDKDIRELKGIKICAIGTKTAEEIKKYGIRVDLIPDEFHAEGLIDSFMRLSSLNNASPNAPVTPGRAEESRTSEKRSQKPGLLTGMRFLLPRAEKAREIFPEKIRALGGEIDVPVAYRTVKPESRGKRLRRFLREGRISVATFTSAATFHNFREIMGDDADEQLKGVSIAAIGPVTAKAVEKAGFHVDIMPRQATIEAMVEEIIQWVKKKETREIQSHE